MNQKGLNLYVSTYLVHKELCESFGEFTVWTAQDELQHVAMHLLHDNVDLDTRGLGGRDEVGEQLSKYVCTYAHAHHSYSSPTSNGSALLIHPQREPCVLTFSGVSNICSKVTMPG